jgi:putative FmdB family regulatory protein
LPIRRARHTFGDQVQPSGVAVPTYAFRCTGCGEFEVVAPMSAASASAACPACGEPAARRYGAPALRGTDPGLRGALDTSARSADSPEVVTAVPGRPRGGVRTTTDPRHARLPRP